MTLGTFRFGAFANEFLGIPIKKKRQDSIFGFRNDPRSPRCQRSRASDREKEEHP